ncbi:glycosyltransferase family 2 protein [Breznakia pachnodae]|uniref:Glycosyltransferase involved in cell wall biosynthesis n=1 Tax=Breznakia pachnodae TaxID=265178 RepID=A0ABU0DYT4_9FIRM|nr:glycosyltransferase family 2 protein [Breznakia pachnodae]MDQ0359803.1 glycosyltransferase involved in cell wall biosynthesis [Breznakia pachnodae]
MKDIISVVIPAYNREKQIGRCLDSLLSQSYEHMEIIVVNDGSTDNTKQILDDYQKQYPDKLIAIHTENRGVSEARNAGIERVSGKYMGFIDSDDYVAKDMYEKLYAKITEDDFDVVACNSLSIYPDRKDIVNSGMYDYQDNHELLIDAYTVLWNKLYKTEIVKNYRFKPNVWYEDVLILNQIYPEIKKVAGISDVGYYYVQNEGSITYTYNDKLYQLVENMDDLVDYYKQHGYYDDYRDELEYTYVRYLFGTFIKRLAKAKDYKKFKEGTRYVMKKVNEQFPSYKKNKYLNEKNGKSTYLKQFNLLLATVIYFKEKNKMN